MFDRPIRLTESDLHRIVKESVNSILNEIRFRGESFHGDNPADWTAVSDLRFTLGDVNKVIYDYGTGNGVGQYDDDFLTQDRKDRWNGIDDNNNAMSFRKGMDIADWKNSRKEGQKKAKRIKQGMFDKYYNKKQPVF